MTRNQASHLLPPIAGARIALLAERTTGLARTLYIPAKGSRSRFPRHPMGGKPETWLTVEIMTGIQRPGSHLEACSASVSPFFL